MPNSDYARMRILDASSDLFGKIGYTGTTVRMIAQQADVSISAIPYHFENKENLYKIVIEMATREFSNYFAPIEMEIQSFLRSKQQDSSIAQELLFRLFNLHLNYVFDNRNQKQLRLFYQTRAFNDLSSNLREIVNLPTTSLFEKLISIIKPNLSREQACLLTYSVIGEQLFFFYHKPSVLQNLQIADFDAESIGMIRDVLTKKLECILTNSDF